jgi:hypothetical protein
MLISLNLTFPVVNHIQLIVAVKHLCVFYEEFYVLHVLVAIDKLS